MKDKIFIEIVGAYLNSYAFGVFSYHNVWSMIISYLEFFSYGWDNKSLKIGIKDLAKLFYEKDKTLEEYFQINMFDHYIELKRYIISNTEQAINWFETLDKELQIKLFNKYTLENIANIFRISQKNHTNFIKTLNTTKNNNEKPLILFNWYKRMKILKFESKRISNIWFN